MTSAASEATKRSATCPLLSPFIRPGMPNLVFSMDAPSGKSAVRDTNDRAHSLRMRVENRSAQGATDKVSRFVLPNGQNHERLSRMTQ